MNFNVLQNVANRLHQTLKTSGLIAAKYGLLAKEIYYLRYINASKTAHDIAIHQNVTVRTIELRLASARKKINTKTTTEAVFKAATYGILKRGNNLGPTNN